MMKKKNAIMIADTRPALIGNLLVQIKETNNGLFDEAIIYYTDLNEKDKSIMENIMPCRFVKFEYILPNNVKSLPAFEKFSPLMFARYYMFDLLKEYETITWLDTDVLICGRLDSIIQKAKEKGMSANFEDPENKSYKAPDTVRTSFKMPLSNYDMTKYNMSSGLITVADTLKDFDKMTKWCFDKTIEYANYLVLPDQGILNILIQEFNIEVACVGEKGAYCFYPSYKRDASNAKIVHAWGARKFWKSWYLFKTYPKWYEYYQKWLNLGGSDCFGEIKPDVSVIIPMYKPNIEYFKKVLDDLLIKQEQEHGFQYDNFEVILVVDGNENEELIKLLNKYNDPRVNLIINKERAGIAKSLNIGIKNAKAGFIARIDDDDRIEKTRLFKQVQYLKQHKDIDLVTSDFEYFGDLNEKRISFDGEMAHAWSIFTCPFDHPTIMFKKEFFVKNDLFYDESRSHVEDWELWLRAFDKGLKVGSIPEVLYYHRWYNGQAGQNEKTIEMMRELVKKNFSKLGVKLNDNDLAIISPWQGKVDTDNFNRIEEIFLKTLELNKEKNIYDQRCLTKAFEYRLFEAKNGYIKDIAIKIDRHSIDNSSTDLKRKIKQKLLGPIYKPFRRVFYNITSEAVNDNLRNVDSLIKKHEIEEKNIDSKSEDYSVQLRSLHDQLYDLEKKYDFLRENYISNLYSEKKVVLIGTSEHSNIGDAAITLGEYEFFRKYFSEYKLVEVSTYEFNDNISYLENIINPDDLIFLQGGGNLGNKYIVEENLRRKVIETFANNKIVILPQTIYFDESENAQKELKISQDIYNRHSNLIILTRGNISLDFAKKYFYNSKAYETLDSALNMNFNYNYNKEGILCCIRDLSDESGLNKKLYNSIFDVVKKYDSNYSYTNNLYETDIRKGIKNTVVYEQFKKFSKHKLIITDRLHGLIFSLITNTPCIVISSYNYKLNEFYDQIKNNKYVRFIDKDIDSLEKNIKELLELDLSKYRNDYSKTFEKISEIIKDENK